MEINIVTVRSGWILQKIAERIAANAPDGVKIKISHWPVVGGNNFYVDIQNCYRGRTNGRDVGLFTHVHENDMKNIPDHYFDIDAIVHMSKRSQEKFFLDKRYQQYMTPMFAIMPGEAPKDFYYNKPIIGIIQRGKYKGKGFDFLKNFTSHYSNIARRFNWTFIGNDWDEVVDIINGYSSVLYHKDSKLEWPNGYYIFYREMDYLLIPSLWEGGPMNLIEAASLGKKIIAADVGWVNREIPVYKSFDAGSHTQLADILIEETDSIVRAREAIEELSYKNYARQLIDIFEEI